MLFSANQASRPNPEITLRNRECICGIVSLVEAPVKKAGSSEDVSREKSVVVDLPDLVKLFFAEPAELGIFTTRNSGTLPEPAGSLLDHHHHMTVTVENHHGCAVDVEVLRHRREGDYYSREILLRRQTDRVAVLYGIVRISLGALPPQVSEMILQRKTPLGRILIENDVLRRVQLVGLYDVLAGPRLKENIPTRSGTGGDTHCFGRTAMIHVDSRPAIELLEIVI